MSDNMCVIQCVSSSKNEWLSTQLDELIDLWEEQRILYDVSHHDYKNRKKKQRIIEEIAVHVSRTGHEVKTKMKNLRSQFLAEIRKQRESAKHGAEVSDLYTSKWKYFGRLAFILTNYPIADLGNITASTCSNDVSDAEEDTTFDATDDSLGPTVKHETARSKSRKVKRQKRAPDPVFEPEDISQKSAQSGDSLQIREHEREDGCDVFGRHIANELRSLSVRCCQLAKLKIQQVVYELQTADSVDLNQQTFSHPTIETSPLSAMPQAPYKESKNDSDKDPLI